MRVWEATAVMRGYNRRHRLTQELIRLSAYSSFFSFRGNEHHLTPEAWMPLPWEQRKAEASPLSDEERQALEAEMEAANRDGGFSSLFATAAAGDALHSGSSQS